MGVGSQEEVEDARVSKRRWRKDCCDWINEAGGDALVPGTEIRQARDQDMYLGTNLPHIISQQHLPKFDRSSGFCDM